MRKKTARRGISVPRINVPWIGLTVRLGLAAAAMGIAALEGHLFLIVPWAMSIAAADVLIVVLRHWRHGLKPAQEVTSILSLCALAAMAIQVHNDASTFVLLSIAAVHAGLALGWLGALLAGWGVLAASVMLVELTTHHQLSGWGLLITTVVMMVIALVASLWRAVPEEKDTAAGEARELLLRLATLADSLDTGFDIPALGDAALAEIAEEVTVDRAAVILRSGDDAVPIALHGHTRMPWPAPTDEGSPLARTWGDGVAFHWVHSEDGRHKYGLTVPMCDSQGQQAGLIALDRRHGPFSLSDQAIVEGVSRRTAPILDVGVLFSRLRGRAALEERSRIARDMHDGVAQELAALAFQVDMLIQQQEPGSQVRKQLETLSQSLRGSLDDVRHQISSLRMVERPTVSLGAILSQTLQLFGTQTGARTTMTINETMFRFPAHIEVQLHRLALDFLADGRSCGAGMIDWEVNLSAPNALLTFKHDGVSALGPEAFADHPLSRHAHIAVGTLTPHGFFVEVLIGAETGHTELLPVSKQLEELTLAGENAVTSAP